MDAEDMLLREFLGIREAGKTARGATWIRSQQREDGTWTNFAGGPGDLSTTIEAYVALKLAGDDPGQPHMRRAAEWVRAHGGLESARVFTHIWMALFGAWDWKQVPALLPEMIVLPPWFPLNVYDFACWARQTVVALSVVLALRPVRQPTPSSPSIACCRPTSVIRSGRCAGSACARWSGGSPTARSPTAAGAGSNPPGSTR